MIGALVYLLIDQQVGNATLFELHADTAWPKTSRLPRVYIAFYEPRVTLQALSGEAIQQRAYLVCIEAPMYEFLTQLMARVLAPSQEL